MGEKLWVAIIAMGVVDVEGRNKLVSRIVELEQGKVIEKEGEKENNIVV